MRGPARAYCVHARRGANGFSAGQPTASCFRDFVLSALYCSTQIAPGAGDSESAPETESDCLARVVQCFVRFHRDNPPHSACHMPDQRSVFSQPLESGWQICKNSWSMSRHTPCSSVHAHHNTSEPAVSPLQHRVVEPRTLVPSAIPPVKPAVPMSHVIEEVADILATLELVILGVF